MDASSVLVAQQALARQDVTLSLIKQTADAQSQVADILTQALEVSPSGRGGSVNFTA